MNHNTVNLHPLTFLTEEEGVNIGRYGTDTFAVFPEEGAEIVRRFQEGKTISEVCEWYQATYNEELDIEDFLATLQELTFIKETADETDPGETSYIKGQRLGRWLFKSPAYLLYLLIIGGAAWMMWNDPSLLPSREHIAFSEYSTIVVLGLLVGDLPATFFHEGMHLAAGRRLGMPSKLGIGRRMYMIVFESSMPGIWGIPKKRRYMPFLAGMLADVIFYSACILVAGWLIRSGGSAGWASYLCALAYLTILHFVWQFYFFLQTDIYYVILNLSGSRNLQQAARATLRNYWYTVRNAREKKIDMSQFTDRDRKVAGWYVFLYAGGWLFMAGTLLYMTPVMLGLLWDTYHHLVSGTSIQRWDAIVFAGLTFVELGFAAYLYRKEIVQRKRARAGVAANQELGA
ncbi:hypothetical protein [Cohnella panacarvi]|uniref:hypothetical protein n=1 Tax=Cohnella panacarvi TaxID=400776 RepID=UPI00047C38D0|nr:hypothetical protein [Cohnella panacarvi]